MGTADQPVSPQEWDGPTTRYEITVLGADDVLDALAAGIRAALPGRRFFAWRALPVQPATERGDETEEWDEMTESEKRAAVRALADRQHATDDLW